MWCGVCRADVAAELSADNRRMLCARCQTELGSAAGALERPAAAPRLQETERNARELLARWSTQHLLEPPLSGTAAQLAGELPPSKPSLRIDAAHSSVPAPNTDSAPTGERLEKRKRRVKPKNLHLTQTPVVEPVRSTAQDDIVRKAMTQPAERKANWATTAGQLCAYAGVGVLTLGTVMVLSGYFGGPTNYAPTGWLVAAVGQMLLFLGVVTLVSGGMEQTVDEVAWRIDALAEQIHDLEQVISAQQQEFDRIRRRAERRGRRPNRDQSDAA